MHTSLVAREQVENEKTGKNFDEARVGRHDAVVIGNDGVKFNACHQCSVGVMRRF